MFANSQSAGTDVAVPDTCMTPTPTPTPIPYPNAATGQTAIPVAYNILVEGTPVHNMATIIPFTNGDNAGIATGVASGTVMGPSRHVTGAFTVLFKGTPATRLTSLSLQNSTNSPGSRLSASQTKLSLLAA
ncbi:DUF4150 domain-containing protein [Serratia silvae]|uniref:DUF4150 domain-containing protein n=1 Tax=Serratia silvae TaxID=2824122 RepID=A0ABT0KB16_9GAMM|nr:DUF4150 domain-containing protein [Serratia silvae]MCL1029146.1 DUF4150 domain-containing protein [Serratia silvae]